jgi:glycosyltransferase domain-containing protein
MEKNNNNYNVTVLLTIYNRLDFTKKWLDFAEMQKLPFKILISDGGNVNNVVEILNLKNRNLDIIYKKYKFYTNYKNFFEKFFFAINQVKTDYVILCEDDDYINISGIIKSANFLKKNMEYSCVKGINLCGEASDKKSIFNYLALRKEDKNFCNLSIRNKKSEDRLISYYKNNHLSLYNGLNRKSVLLKVFSVLNRDFHDLYITELIFVLLVINEGKIKRNNYVDYVKMDNTLLSSSSNFKKFRPYEKIIKSRKFNYENNLVLKHLDIKNKKSTFLNMHKNFIKKGSFLRIENEKNNKKISTIIYFIFKFLIKKLKIKNLLISICYYIKYKKITNKIYVKDNDITPFLKKQIFFFKNIFAHIHNEI